MEPNLFTKDEDNKEALLAIQEIKHILILSEANHLQTNRSLHGRYLFGAVNAHLIRHSFTICIFEKPHLLNLHPDIWWHKYTADGLLHTQRCPIHRTDSCVVMFSRVYLLRTRKTHLHWIQSQQLRSHIQI
jgi:hypothetical protein